MYGTTQAVIDDVNLWPGIKDHIIADLAEGIYVAGAVALTSYDTTTTDYATQFGVFVHDEGKRINKTTGVTETYTLDAAYTPEGMLKNLVAQVRLRDHLNNLTGANATSAENVFKEFANRMYGTTQAVIDDVNLWPGIKDQMIADLAEGIYAAGPEALTSYDTTTTDYATQFGVFVHDEGKRVNKTTGVTETFTLDAAYTPEGMLKNLVAQVRLRDYLNSLTDPDENIFSAETVFMEYANRAYGTSQAVIEGPLWDGIKDQMIADLAEGIYWKQEQLR